MMRAAFLFLLFLTAAGHESSDRNCSYAEVLQYLNLTNNKEVFYMTRPVINYKTPTEVYLDVLLYAILDVVEKDQQLVAYVWIDMWWYSEHIGWDPDDFCGIENFTLPTEVLWKPDLTIEEMTEKDKAPPSPHLTIYNDSKVEITNDQVLVSTCRMHIYSFPFDIQKCNITFKSVVHSVEEMHLIQYLDSTKTTEWSRQLMRTQDEWLFINMTVTNRTVNNFGFVQSVLVYTISIRRRSALYIVNFLLPILFFFCLDLASFMISDSGGEKLGFKVTVLLAVTVLQLILNEILPASSNRIPLIAIYCIGIFGLMMLSLLETILVMYLLRKDDKADENQRLREDCGDQPGKVNFHRCRDISTLIPCGSVYDVSPGDTTPELVPAAKEPCSTQLMEEEHDLRTTIHELNGAVKALSLLLNGRNEGTKCGYWNRVTKIINRIFFVFYVIAASLFLACMFFNWNIVDPDEL